MMYDTAKGLEYRFIIYLRSLKKILILLMIIMTIIMIVPSFKVYDQICVYLFLDNPLPYACN